jgi:hypothetical protein
MRMRVAYRRIGGELSEQRVREIDTWLKHLQPSHLDVREIACPECGAAIGEPCYYTRLRYGTEPYRTSNHQTRINAYLSHRT